MKKAQGLSLNTIVVAVLVLLILVVLLFIVNKYIIGTGDELGSFSQCEKQADGASCKSECDSNEQGFYRTSGCGSGNFEDEPYCCVPKLT